MAQSNRSNAIWIAPVLAAAMLVALPAVTAAQGKAQHTWLAAATQSPTADSTWGRLMVKDGVLSFASERAQWQKPLSEIKRIAETKGGKRMFEIVATNGDVLYVSILGQQMITESPRRAMDMIERAMRDAPATPRPALAAAAGGGSSF
jgi:hypothetical protein